MRAGPHTEASELRHSASTTALIAARLAVCVAAVVPYLPTVDDYFVQDDFGVVWLLSQKPWNYFPRWFGSTWMDDIWGFTPDEIRPFPAVTYQVAAWWGAGSPAANHVINIALHGVNGLLVLEIARKVLRLELAAAALAALVFVVLPVQAESVAWVTGRVDSMPAAAYAGAFLLYALWRQRQNASGEPPVGSSLYWASVGVYFVALFTKQNTVTLLPAVVLYDIVLGGRPMRLSWAWVRPYVPFALLTLGYLVLRYVLFGDVARESQLTASALGYFGSVAVRHAARVTFGAPGMATPLLLLLVAALLLALACAAPRLTLFFGALWWTLGIAPVVVALYESPRHVYLASMAWAWMLGLAFHLVPRRRAMRMAATAGALVILSIYVVQLARVVGEWSTRAAVSQQAVADLEREIVDAPPGALIVASAPLRSWEWAMPFVLRAPFVRAGLEERALVITPQALHCCRADWDARTRSLLRTWLARRDGAPAIALRWDAATGARHRLSDREEPYLRELLAVMADTDSAAALDRAILTLADQLPPAPR